MSDLLENNINLENTFDIVFQNFSKLINENLKINKPTIVFKNFPDLEKHNIQSRDFKSEYFNEEDKIGGNLYSWIHQSYSVLWEINKETNEIVIFTKTIEKLGYRFATVLKMEKQLAIDGVFTLIIALAISDIYWQTKFKEGFSEELRLQFIFSFVNIYLDTNNDYLKVLSKFISMFEKDIKLEIESKNFENIWHPLKLNVDLIKLKIKKMKATKFWSLKNINGDRKFHRKEGDYINGGVYFWGFNVSEDFTMPPKDENDFVIYYIGKSKKNVIERIMQEVTQLIFGGFGTIIDHKWLEKNQHKARIHCKQEDKKDKDVLYRSDGLYRLYDFFDNKKIAPTIKWMRERLIFGWIDNINENDLNKVENEFHHIVRTNVLGIGKMSNPTPKKDARNAITTPYFNNIDWTNNEHLKKWFIEVNNNITLK